MENVWDHLSPNGMATNRHPLYGGIVDYAIVSGKYFVIANDDRIPSAEGFDTKREAFAYLKQEIARIAKETSEYKL